MKRKHEATKVLGDIAADFRCSITATLIADPVITADGHLYERAAIAEWLRTRDTSPKTGKRLDSKILTPSPTVRSATERLIDSGHLPVEEVREWQTRKAAVLIRDGRTEDAKAMLLDAKAAGDAGAGLHLGKLFLAEARSLIAEAEAAGVEDAAETLRAHWPSADVAPPGAEPLRSVRDVRIGQRVRVLSLDVARTAMQSHPCGWNAQMEEFCGVLSKVLKKDDGDGTLQLSNPVAGGSCYWFSVGCCVKP